MPKKAMKKDQPEKKETQTVEKIALDERSDAFSPEEKKDIVQMIKDDIKYGEEIQADYISQKELDLKHYHGAKPSELEGLTKKNWQSDRNLGLARAVADAYQATFLATCWNPDSINFVATRVNEIDNRNNQEKFTKWGMGVQEANVHPEVDDFIHNRIVVGTSFFKIYRKITEEWVDKRIPKKDKDGKTYKYEIKTEKMRFEKGVIENIADIDDILMPEYGRNLQELSFFIHILHLDGETVIDYTDRRVLAPANKDEYKNKLHNHAYKDKERKLGKEKLQSLGITESTITDIDVRRLPIDLYEWYGYYTKGGRTEKFRFIIDAKNEEFLSGKPLRKINRSGKIPFVGGSLNKEPGQLRGASLMQVIAPIVNAFNNVFNQKSDFQYVTNCPFGFYVPDEGYTQQKYELEPMVCYPVGGKPSDNVYFPNLSRPMGWAESDIRILFEVLERLTGAASYFNTSQLRNKTLGQDMLVKGDSDTRFGLGVSRIQEDLTEAISMWFELYQDYPPKNLAERIIGKDGERLFPNLSIDSLRGDTQVQMSPDTVAGSKAHRKQIQLWAFQASQGMIWLNPQINPQGNWQMCSDTLAEVLNMNEGEVERYLGKKPPGKFDEAELDNEWIKFMNGEDFDPPEGETMLAKQHLEGHMKQKIEKYHKLDEEYRPNFDAHLFKTIVNYMKFMRNAQQEQIATTMAAGMASQGQVPQQPGQGQPQAPNVQPTPQGTQNMAPVAQPGQMPGQGMNA